jgi:hypothetical protein
MGSQAHFSLQQRRAVLRKAGGPVDKVLARRRNPFDHALVRQTIDIFNAFFRNIIK